MIDFILEMLKNAKYNSTENIKIAKGKNKLPENWSEFKRAMKNIKDR